LDIGHVYTAANTDAQSLIQTPDPSCIWPQKDKSALIIRTFVEISGIEEDQQACNLLCVVIQWQ